MPGIKVQKVMTREVITAESQDSVIDIIKKLSENDISGVPVVDDEYNVIGIISEKDILRALKTESRTLSLIFPSSHALGMSFEESVDHRELKEALKEIKKMKIKDIMNKDVIAIDPSMTLAEGANIMIKHNINRIPVVKKEKLIGIVTRGDIIKGISKLK